jgi:hypothetical protein
MRRLLGVLIGWWAASTARHTLESTRLNARRTISCVVLCLWAGLPASAETAAAAQTYATLDDIAYYDAAARERGGDYLRERC